MSNGDVEMQDDEAAKEEHMMYGHGTMTEQELDEKYPNRPHNHSKSLPFHELYLTLFNPLNENKKKPGGPAAARRKQGPHVATTAPNEVRRTIIDRFISRWRQEVGRDIYPALRLIVPEKDRDRAMYGLKEQSLAKLIIKILQINKDSDDAQNLLKWKLPGFKASTAMAGDFAGRCYEVISKRPLRSTPGDMTIAEVNERLDALSMAQKEENQRPILQEFYNRMNAEELMWLIRMILRQMKVGATEKTFFDIWHPDAENLFNISSNLRRVCWELYDPQVRLEGNNRGVALMQCFQPQLAAFQPKSWDLMVSKMKPTEEDPNFWIEEKLDGERMQLHMIEHEDDPTERKFKFWSRKAKDYTYLYGNSFGDNNAALTRHIREAFADGVRNLILDGEMITWDPKEDAIVPFGTLKTAALDQQSNPFSTGIRPLYRVFDILYLNDKDLTHYTLRDRRKALDASINSIHRRIEIHDYKEATQASEIEPLLRQVVAESSEGLVLKNPRSEYRLNDRNDDWVKVKPEYMTEFGESLDCIVVGGYYGSGKRGGGLSSFLCGLYISRDLFGNIPGGNPQKTWSFFKVGGGFSANDYAEIRHRTEGKWMDWDPKKPPYDWIELGGGELQYERPDVWIKPEDSVVISVKAASVHGTPQFRTQNTLRFPRFKKLRYDKKWDQALSFHDWKDLKKRVEDEQLEKKMNIDESRKNKRNSRKKPKKIVIQGQEDQDVKTPYAGPATNVFEGLSFFIITDAPKPIKKTKAELAEIVKANGGTVVASEADPNTICIADARPIKVASIQKRDDRNIIRPRWLLDCIKQSELDVGRPNLLLPLEPDHIYYEASKNRGKYEENIDGYGDSYARDVTSEELLQLFEKMPPTMDEGYDPMGVLDQFINHDLGLDAMPGWMFHGVIAHFSEDVGRETERLFQFAGGLVAGDLGREEITHVVVDAGDDVKEIRRAVSGRKRLPRIVTKEWVMESWAEGTRLDEERFAPV